MKITNKSLFLALGALFFLFTSSAFAQKPGEDFVAVGISANAIEGTAGPSLVGVKSLRNYEKIRGSFTTRVSKIEDLKFQREIEVSGEYAASFLPFSYGTTSINLSRKPNYRGIPVNIIQAGFGLRVDIPSPDTTSIELAAGIKLKRQNFASYGFEGEFRKRSPSRDRGPFASAQLERESEVVYHPKNHEMTASLGSQTHRSWILKGSFGFYWGRGGHEE